MPSKNIGKRIADVKIGQKKVLIKFEGEDKALEILPNTFTEFKLFKGKILSNKDIRDIKARNNVEKYYDKALTLLSRKSYSEKKIVEKLTNLGASEEEIELVLKELYKYSLLDDKSVIDEYIEYAEVHNYGYNRIKQELYNRGVKKSLIDKIPYNEVNELKKAKNALNKLEKKYSKENNFTKKKKIRDSLLRLGFSFDIAKEVSDLVEENTKEVELELLRGDFGTAYMRYRFKSLGEELYQKVLNYLLKKGYRYQDIELIKGEYFHEMD